MARIVEIARPGDETASAALYGYHRGLRNPPGWYLGLIAVAWTNNPNDLFRVAAWTLLVLTGVAVFGTIGMYLLRRHRYRTQVAAGNIVRLDPYLVTTWDELRRHHGVALTNQERAEHLRDLFDAAVDLQPTCAEYDQCQGERGLEDRALRAQARIRVRLRQEVIALRDALETRRQMALIRGEVDDDSPEMRAELEALRRDREEAAGHDVDTVDTPTQPDSDELSDVSPAAGTVRDVRP